MLKSVEVESGIPIPPACDHRKTWMTLTMGVGDSIRIEHRYGNSVASRVRNHLKTHPGEKFTQRTMTDDRGEKYIRVWRIA